MDQEIVKLNEEVTKLRQKCKSQEAGLYFISCYLAQINPIFMSMEVASRYCLRFYRALTHYVWFHTKIRAFNVKRSIKQECLHPPLEHCTDSADEAPSLIFII